MENGMEYEIIKYYGSDTGWEFEDYASDFEAAVVKFDAYAGVVAICDADGNIVIQKGDPDVEDRLSAAARGR